MTQIPTGSVPLVDFAIEGRMNLVKPIDANHERSWKLCSNCLFNILYYIVHRKLVLGLHQKISFFKKNL